MKPKLHLIGLFHTVPSAAFSHCAFTGKVVRFSKMMQARGYTVVEYANGRSESVAAEKVQMMSEEELEAYIGKFMGNHSEAAQVESPQWKVFDGRLRDALRARVMPGDYILHPFGQSHKKLVADFPEQTHIETGIGYPDGDFGAFRIFESITWQAYHYGRDRHHRGADFSWVIPNYYDLDDWTSQESPGGYVLFCGRVCESKGMAVLQAIAQQGVKIKVVGQGEIPTQFVHPNLEKIAPVLGRKRDLLFGGARCLLMPTRYVEPFGGVGIEAQLCGTPLIASPFGCFHETIEHGVNGFRCNTLGDWLRAIELSAGLDRSQIAARSRSLYSLERCGAMYQSAFETLQAFWTGRADSGWFCLDSTL